MPRGGKLAFILSLWTLGTGGWQSPPDRPTGPPPLNLPFDRVTAEAIHELGTVASIGSTPDALWVAAANPPRAVRLDPSGKADPETLALPADPCGNVAGGFGAVWIPLCAARAIARVDLETKAVTTLAVADLDPSGGSLTTGVGSLWLLADDRGTLLRIDPVKGQVVADVYLPPGTSAIEFGQKAIWAAGGTADRVVKVNPHTNLIEKSIAAGRTPRRIAVTDEAVWALAETGRAVLRLDGSAGRVTATIDLGVAAEGGVIAAGEGSVWVSAPGAPLVRIDPRSSRVVQVFTGNGGGGAIVAAHRSLWMAAGTSLRRIDPRFVAALR